MCKKVPPYMCKLIPLIGKNLYTLCFGYCSGGLRLNLVSAIRTKSIPNLQQSRQGIDPRGTRYCVKMEIISIPYQPDRYYARIFFFLYHTSFYFVNRGFPSFCIGAFPQFDGIFSQCGFMNSPFSIFVPCSSSCVNRGIPSF